MDQNIINKIRINYEGSALTFMAIRSLDGAMLLDIGNK